jgi:hypothetical protein
MLVVLTFESMCCVAVKDESVIFLSGRESFFLVQEYTWILWHLNKYF